MNEMHFPNGLQESQIEQFVTNGSTIDGIREQATDGMRIVTWQQTYVPLRRVLEREMPELFIFPHTKGKIAGKGRGGFDITLAGPHTHLIPEERTVLDPELFVGYMQTAFFDQFWNKYAVSQVGVDMWGDYMRRFTRRQNVVPSGKVHPITLEALLSTSIRLIWQTLQQSESPVDFATINPQTQKRFGRGIPHTFLQEKYRFDHKPTGNLVIRKKGGGRPMTELDAVMYLESGGERRLYVFDATSSADEAEDKHDVFSQKTRPKLFHDDAAEDTHLVTICPGQCAFPLHIETGARDDVDQLTELTRIRGLNGRNVDRAKLHLRNNIDLITSADVLRIARNRPVAVPC